MSLSQPPLPPESPIVIPPTPAGSSGAPAQGGGGGGGTLAPAGTRGGSKPPSPPRIDSGVVLEEALQQALTLGEGEEGSEAEKQLEEREQAAVARPPALSAHSSGARSVASLQSAATQYASQRPSPSSGRGSYNTAWSSRSPNSRASSGSNIHDYSSTRSSFERRSSSHNHPYPPQVGSRSQLHLHVPPGGPYQGVSSPYGYSPSQHTPSDGSAGGVQYPYGTFYHSPAFYHPYPQHQQQAQQGGEAVYPHHQYGGSPPAFIAYQPFTSPLPSPHPSSQYSPASFPFSAAGPTYSPYAPIAPGLAAPPPSHPGVGLRRGSSDIVYDDQGNPISPVELSSPIAGGGGGGGGTAYYYPQPQPSQQQQVSPETLASLDAQGQAGVYPPPPPPHQPPAGNGYQPVYVFPPPPPPPPAATSYAASPPSAPYAALHPPPPPPPLHPPSAPPGPQYRPEQPLSYPISSARPASPARGNGSATEQLVYPISHSTAASLTVAAPQPAEAVPPPPPPPLPYYYPQPQAHGQPYPSQPPPPPPPGALYPSPHPSSIPYTPSASAPLPQHLHHPHPHPHAHPLPPLPIPAHQQQQQQQPAQPLSPTHSHLSNGFSASVSQSHSHSHSRESSAASISLVGATGLPLTAASTASTAGTGGAGGVDLPQPRVYEVPSTPARGQLAQAGLRKAAAAGMGPGVGAVSPAQQQQQQQGFSPPTGGGGGRLGGMGMPMGMRMAGRRDLPRPPAHSPFALWVGNVPSDASHAELWSFFQGRPVPSAEGVVAGAGEEGLNLDETGIESIHLIARSNCAFVNYTSSLHLRHAITVSNGLSLRPSDPRCKTFLCRERKTDDDFKSGVGAQRVGGMHRSYIREQRERMAEGQRVIRQQREAQMLQQRREREREESLKSGGSGFPSAPSASAKEGEGENGRPSPDAIAKTAVEKEEGKEGALSARRQSTVSCLSVGSGTTTSTFLAKHFERRYFILKSHDEADLRLSVETGLWATQAHNEPVLQQAFRTAKTVYLCFGANGQGAWFGVARMAGPISGNATSSSGGSRPSWSSRDGGSSTLSSSAGGLSGGGAGATSLSAASQTIMEDEEEPSSFPARPPLVLTDSDSRLATSSPLNMSPALPRTMGTGLGRNGGGSESAPATLAPTAIGPGRVSSAAKQAMSIEADLVARETADNLHLPAEVVARRAATFDDQKMGRRVQESESAISTATGTGTGTGKMGLESEAERRNFRLEAMEDKTEEPVGTSAAPLTTAGRTGSANWGTPFAVEWITVRNLPFARTKHIRNSFNGNREIKISRDGTEVEPTAGEALLSVFWAEDPDASPSSPPVPSSTSASSPASSRSPPGRVASGMVGGAVVVEGVEKV